ncbi:L,D-transpeptidase family protein [Luteipulveratus sp. YIM 133132]|uniref:L,D-transpeptidase family protein n=1 Tax=Luteipulveratus flavus TaxID=3031728 RepID=UPI0023AF50C6|nr:L,D-transpeptidase family protein [Luteipulveratus sp. YIM 133132]MDE9366507.1 L,D-transpeptidase family protein [Luteipulveratus sp. YIM 133132]
MGDSGPDVLAVQQRLRDLGYWALAPDGTYGSSTKQAVYALQKASGIGRNGRVDTATRAALDQGVVPRSRTGAGKAVEIDLDRQLLLAVEGGRVRAVINASSGNGETFTVTDKKTGTETEYRARTPRGSFRVYLEDDKNHESTLELGSMWRPKYFHGGIAVHGSGSIPPFPASHGCVRVSNSAMNWLWDTWGLPIGTPVTVY